jgi:RHS repeat-associated protein
LAVPIYHPGCPHLSPPSEKQLDEPKSLQLQKRARYYDPSTGEFISRDPLEYVDGMSQYRAYFAIAGVDSLGMKSADPITVKECFEGLDWHYDMCDRALITRLARCEAMTGLLKIRCRLAERFSHAQCKAQGWANWIDCMDDAVETKRCVVVVAAAAVAVKCTLKNCTKIRLPKLPKLKCPKIPIPAIPSTGPTFGIPLPDWMLPGYRGPCLLLPKR